MKAENERNYDEFTKKLLAGLELSYQRLLEYKRQKNSVLDIVKDGKIVKVKP